MYVGKECPVCRAPLNAVRTFFRPAWSRWRCAACGSTIGIGTTRRLVSVGFFTAALFAWLLLMRRSPAPELLSLTAIALLGLVAVAIVDRIIVVERMGFHCLGCGYDLRGTSDDTCPECGDAIGAELRARAARLTPADDARPTRSWVARWGLMIAVLLFGLTLMLVGVTRYLRASQPPGGQAPGVSSPMGAP